jgi:hypothetical protein
MTVYEYFENSEYNKATLCITPNSTYTLTKEYGRVGLHISILPKDSRIIFDEEIIKQEIDKLLSIGCADTISFVREMKINQILNS